MKTCYYKTTDDGKIQLVSEAGRAIGVACDSIGEARRNAEAAGYALKGAI